MTITIRDATPDDEAEWRRLWDGYLAFYDIALAPEITAEGDYHAVVVDLENDGDQERTWIAQLRQDCPKVEILALVDQRFKDRLNRLKVELGVFSFVPLPLDPFDLARRIVRLEQHLIERHPMMK